VPPAGPAKDAAARAGPSSRQAALYSTPVAAPASASSVSAACCYCTHLGGFRLRWSEKTYRRAGGRAGGRAGRQAGRQAACFLP
jgi:hypothetical protein